MKQSAEEVWKEKLEHLYKEEAITSDASQKFSIKKQIEEAKEKLTELTSVKVTHIGNQVSDTNGSELNRFDQVLLHADQQADQELWSNVQLKLFSSIEPRVKLLESPFHGEIDHLFSEEDESSTDSNTRTYKLKDFVYNYFWCNWDVLKWQKQTEICRKDLKAPPIMFLTGDAGIGKTASLKIMTSTWREQETGKVILPVYTPLTDIFEACSEHGEVYKFEDMLNHYLQKRYPNCTSDDLITSPDYRFDAIVIILDAFDEASLLGGQSRLSIISGIVRFIDDYLQISHKREGFIIEAEKHKVRGIIIASRQVPTYAERRMLRGATVLTMEQFSNPNIKQWLEVFNRQAKVWKEGAKVSPLKQLKADDFSDAGQYKELKDIISTPLYLYLLSCTLAVDTLAAGPILKLKRNTETKIEDFFALATFNILDAFFSVVRKNSFFNKGAFNYKKEHAPPDSQLSNPDLLRTLLSELVAYAGRSGSRDVNFNRDIEELDKKVIKEWAVRSLPLEVVNNNINGDIWRFPHLSLVDFLLAERLVKKIGSLKHKHVNRPREDESYSSWWIGLDTEFRDATIEAGQMIISDRAFGYMEQHLERVKDSKSKITKVETVRDVARVWASLHAVIVPADPNMQITQTEYIVAERKNDLGLRIANLGLPLLGSSLRVLKQKFDVGEEAENNDASRHGLRQYLRLASFFLDSEIINGGAVNRLPLTKLESRKSSIEGMDMKDVILNSGRLCESELQHAYLMNANLSWIFIDKDCNLQDANLVAANLQHAIFESELYIEGVSLFKADLRHATMENVTLALCNMVGAKLQNAHLQKANFDYCSMMSVNLKGADMRNVHIKNSILIDASLENADLTGATFEEGVLMNLEFKGAILDGAKFINPIGMTRKVIQDLKSKGAQFLNKKTKHPKP